MEQKKIGKFIAELRKNHSLTQSQLAEKLNVSDKTISRWETGKGMPEISILIPLCEILEVSVDELLLGEYLDNAQSMYLQEEEKTDATINLTQKTYENSAKNKYSVIFSMLVSMTIMGMILFVLKQGGMDVMFLLDLPSFFVIWIPTMLFLVGTGFWGHFWNGIGIVFRKKADISKDMIAYSREAITLAGNTVFLMGLLVSVLQIVALFCNNKMENWDIMGKNLSVALFPFFYGLLASLLFLFMRGKLLVSRYFMA